MPRWRRSCSRASTSSCSTSRRTTSTSPGSNGWSASSPGLPAGVVLVSHDRAFLDRTVTRVVEIEAETRRVREYAGAWTDYEAARERARAEQERAYAQYIERAVRSSSCWASGRSQAQALGGARKLARQTGGSDRRATQRIARRRCAQARRQLERLEQVDKPWEPWQLQLRSPPRPPAATRRRAPRRGGRARGVPPRPDRPRGRAAATASPRRPQRLRQDDAAPGARSASSRSPRARRSVGPRVRLRRARPGPQPLRPAIRCSPPSPTQPALPPARRARCSPSSDSAPTTSRAPPRPLSPGERTRATLALLAARGVNCLVLDEPTNHLDLEAIEAARDGARDLRGHARRRQPRPPLPRSARDRPHDRARRCVGAGWTSIESARWCIRVTGRPRRRMRQPRRLQKPEISPIRRASDVSAGVWSSLGDHAAGDAKHLREGTVRLRGRGRVRRWGSRRFAGTGRSSAAGRGSA